MDSNNKSIDSNNSPAKDPKETRDVRRQQFTNKQRMDMYAFCVLELEMHSNKVSIKKQQQAIQKVLSKTRKEANNVNNQQTSNIDNQSPQIQQPTQQVVGEHLQIELNQVHLQVQNLPTSIDATNSDTNTTTTTTTIFASTPPLGQQIAYVVVPQPNGETSLLVDSNDQQQQQQQTKQSNTENSTNDEPDSCKTLLQLQQEVARTRKCYSDFQKTQVLTSSMLRAVQERFSRYYPTAAIPSRSTIKHVFEKCVNHGTVENIKTPRKPTKIPQGDEIEYLLIHEPQLSLRQLAQKLNVSTGTVSRRCKALGLVPESVTIKHQQIAAARRQKQIKQLEDMKEASSNNSSTTTASNSEQVPTNPEDNNDLNNDSNNTNNTTLKSEHS